MGLLAPGGVVLVLALGERRRLSAGVVLGVWTAALTVLAAAVTLPLVRSAAGSYQLSALRLSLEPGGVLTRLVQQAAWHLGPLAAAPPLWSGRLVVAAATLALALVASPSGEGIPRRRLARLALTDLGLKVAAWSPLLLTPAPARRPRCRASRRPASVSCSPRQRSSPARSSRAGAAALTLVLSCGVVALGTARTLALQREWDGRSASRPAAPPRAAGGARAGHARGRSSCSWTGGHLPATFTFRHAVSYLYGGRAAASSTAGTTFSARFEDEGITGLPGRPCGGRRENLYGYSALVVVRESGRADAEGAWPPTSLRAPGTASTSLAPGSCAAGGRKSPREWPGITPP
jgi:hypothetical protein